MINIQSPVLLDLNTQRDLFAPEGAYPVVHPEKFVDPLKRIFTWAHRLKIPVVSTRMRYLMAPLPGFIGGAIPSSQKVRQKLICNPQEAGYQKLSATLLRKRLEMPLDCGTDLPVEGFKLSQQFIFDLPSLNPFECPRLDRLLSESEVGLWMIVGAPLEWSVRTAVLGLLQRRQKVAIISDAIGQWDPYEGDMALRQIESKNIEWFTAQQAVERYAKIPPARSPSTLSLLRKTFAPHPAGAPSPVPVHANQSHSQSHSQSHNTGHAPGQTQAPRKSASARGSKSPTRQFR